MSSALHVLIDVATTLHSSLPFCYINFPARPRASTSTAPPATAPAGVALRRVADRMNRDERLVLLIAILASFVSFLDGTIINVALPAISR